MKKSCSTAFLSALHPAGTASDGFCRQVHIGKNCPASRLLYVAYPVRAHFLRCGAVQFFEGPHKDFVIRQPVFLHQYRDRLV